MEGVFRDHFSEIHLMLAGQPLHSDNELTLFIHDVLQFIPAFIIPISQRAPHVYLSALPFSPEQSRVARKFCPRFPNTFVVAEGRPSQWPMVVFTTEHHKGGMWKVVFSLDESTFASISQDVMYVCDSETGHGISGPSQLPGYGIGGDACFSPDGKHILVKSYSYAVIWDIETGEEQFRIEGSNFAFIHHDRRITSTHWVDEDGNSNNFNDKDLTRLLVKLWDASNGALICNRLLEVNDVAVTRFSPDGHYLAVGRESEDVIELWNLEDGKNLRQFAYPPGRLLSLNFSPTSDTLMAVSGENHCHVYLWRFDTQEMVSFSYDFEYFGDRLHVIHSPLTNYLFIYRKHTVEIWDVSVTGAKMIWETKTSPVWSMCPSHDGHRLLVGHSDGSVRMWDLDLEDLARNQADTKDTQDDTDTRQVFRMSPSGTIVVTQSQKSSNVELLNTTTGEIVDIDMHNKPFWDATFSPDEDQVAFLSDTLITICDIMHPEKRISFDSQARKDVRIGTVAFQTCNDLVICTIFDDYSGSLQVWHRQDPAGFECSYSLDLDVDEHSYPYLAPDGLTVIIISASSPTCYSWNHGTAQFDPVHFDDEGHITSIPKYSPGGKLFTSWSDNDSHVRIWDTRTRQLISKFPTSWVDDIAFSPAPIDHSLADRLIALRFRHENAIRLLDAYTGHLHAQILGQAFASLTFIRDGTKLAYHDYAFGLRIWDLTAEHWHSTHGYEHMLQGMTDGWVINHDDEPLFWVPVEHRDYLCVPPFKVVIEGSHIPTKLNFSNSRFGTRWTECIDKEWLRELEQKEKEVGHLLE